MNLLALDTSTEACSVAIALDGAVTERFELGRHHAERILAMVQELLTESGLALGRLDAIAFGRGPGSFTGLRIGAGVVQGLAFGAQLPVVPVSSLAALAQGLDLPKVLAAFDARMRQVYCGAFECDQDGLMTAAGAEIVVDPARVPLPPGRDWIGAGSGWDRYSDSLQRRLEGRIAGWRPLCHPHAQHVARLALAAYERGEAIDPEQALPVYIRDDVAKKKAPTP